VFRPAYLELLASGVLDERVDAAWVHLRSCDLCARYCRVNRFEGIEGAVCRTGERPAAPRRGRAKPEHRDAGEIRPDRDESGTSAKVCLLGGCRGGRMVDGDLPGSAPYAWSGRV
jgi:hypothetical protein